MERQPVQVPRLPRPRPDPIELASRELLMRGRVGEVLLGSEIVKPQRLLGRLELVRGEEPLDDGEALLTQLVQVAVREDRKSVV